MVSRRPFWPQGTACWSGCRSASSAVADSRSYRRLTRGDVDRVSSTWWPPCAETQPVPSQGMRLVKIYSAGRDGDWVWHQSQPSE